MLNRTKYIVSSFHIAIIAIFLLSISGCGYKASPYYENEAPEGDENVEFIIKDKEISKNENNENNESCE